MPVNLRQYGSYARPNTPEDPVEPLLEQDRYARSEWDKSIKKSALGLREAWEASKAMGNRYLGDEAAAQANLRTADALRQRAADPRLQNRVTDVQDVHNLQDAWDWLQYGAGSTAPTVAGMAVGGGAGRALGKGASALARVAPRTAGRAATAGGYAGAAAPYEVQSVGGLYQDLRHDPNAKGTDEEFRDTALAYGTAQTATGLVPVGAAGRAMRSGSLQARIGKGAAAGAVTEGLQEATEGVIGDYGRQQHNPDVDPWDWDARLNEAALGAAMGGSMAGVSVAAEGAQGQAQGRIARRMEAIRQRGTSRGIPETVDLFQFTPEPQPAQAGPGHSDMWVGDFGAQQDAAVDYTVQLAQEVASGQRSLSDPAVREWRTEMENVAPGEWQRALGEAYEELAARPDPTQFDRDELTGNPPKNPVLTPEQVSAMAETDTTVDLGEGAVEEDGVTFEGQDGAQRDVMQTVDTEFDYLTNRDGKPWKWDPEKGSSATKIAEREQGELTPWRDMFDSESEFRAEADRLGIKDPENHVIVRRHRVPEAVRPDMEDTFKAERDNRLEPSHEEKQWWATVRKAFPEAERQALDKKARQVIDKAERKGVGERLILPHKTDPKGRLPKGHIPVQVGDKTMMTNLMNWHQKIMHTRDLQGIEGKTLSRRVAERVLAAITSMENASDQQIRVDVNAIPDNTVLYDGAEGRVTWRNAKHAMRARDGSPTKYGQAYDTGREDTYGQREPSSGDKEPDADAGLRLGQPEDKQQFRWGGPGEAAEYRVAPDVREDAPVDPAAREHPPLTQEQYAEKAGRAAQLRNDKARFNKLGVRKAKRKGEWELEAGGDLEVPTARKVGNQWEVYDAASTRLEKDPETGEQHLTSRVYSGRHPTRNAAVKAYQRSVPTPAAETQTQKATIKEYGKEKTYTLKGSSVEAKRREDKLNEAERQRLIDRLEKDVAEYKAGEKTQAGADRPQKTPAEPKPKAQPEVKVEEVQEEEITIEAPKAAEDEIDLTGVSEREAGVIRRRLDMDSRKDVQRLRAKMERTANAWLKNLGLDFSVKLVDTKENIQRRKQETGDWTQRHPAAQGTAFSGRDGVVTHIYIAPDLPQSLALETLAHEIGHAVQFAKFDQLPLEKKQAILDAYMSWFSQTNDLNTSMAELLKGSYPHHLFKANASNADTRLRDLEPDQLRQVEEYHASFPEWFANQTARWLTTDAEPRGVVETFFSELAELIKRFFAEVAGKETPANEEVAAWLRENWQRYEAGEATSRVRKPPGKKSRGAERAKRDVAADVKRTTKREVTPTEVETAQEVAEDPHGAKAKAGIEEAVARGKVRKPPRQGTTGQNVPPKGPPKDGKPSSGRPDEPPPLLTPEEQNILERAFSTNHVLRQLRELYKHDPVALAEIQENPAKAVAHGMPYWMSGDLKVGPRTETALQKLMDLLREVLGVIHIGDQAKQIIDARNSGELARRAAGESTWSVSRRVTDNTLHKGREFIEDMGRHLAPVAQIPFYNAAERVRAIGNAQLNRLMDDMYVSPHREGKRRSMLEERMHHSAKFQEELHRIFEGQDEMFGEAMARIMNGEIRPENDAERQAERQLRRLLKTMYHYTQDAGMKFNELENYFPRVVDLEHLQRHKDEFIDMLLQEKYKGAVENRDAAERIYDAYMRNAGDSVAAADYLQARIDRGGMDPAEVGIGSPFAANSRKREFRWIESSDIAQFLSKDLGLTMSTYIAQMTKRAEYVRRFSGDNTLEKRFAEARKTGASERDIDTARKAVKAIMGTLGSDIDPRLQKAMGWVMVYENYTILALSTLSSVIEVLNIGMRGDMDALWTGLKEGMRMVKAGMQQENTSMEQMAEALGTIERRGTIEALGYEYGGYYVTGAAKRWNDRLFEWNQLQRWTRASRVMAMAGAESFMLKHKDFNFNSHSRRWMEHLDLREGDVRERDGHLDLLDDEAVLKMEEELDKTESAERKLELAEALERDARVKNALNRWVDETILRPNAATRPIWASDPHWMLVFHLKSFSFAFHERLLKRIVNEAYEGNWKPALWSMSLVPAILTADALRDVFEDEDDERDETFGEALNRGLERSGLYGVGQLARDAMQDVQYGKTGYESLLGPTAEHLSDALKAISGHKAPEDVLIRSLPWQSAWKDWG